MPPRFPTHRPPTLASGGTFLLDDATMSSQALYHPQHSTPHSTPMLSQPGGGGVSVPSRRVILTSEAVEQMLQMTNEGKITTKNAWDLKLLEGIHESVSSAFRLEGDASSLGGTPALATPAAATTAGEGSNSTEDSQFSRVANLVEGGAKIWTQRVEQTCAMSNHIVRRLMRSDGGKADDEGDAENGGEGGGNGEGGAEGDEAARRAAERRMKKRTERTVAETNSEIDLDAASKSAAALQGSGVGAQFRAITEKFEQGHAQGLLLNNTPLGSRGNLILDVDYSAWETQTANAPYPQHHNGGDSSMEGAQAIADIEFSAMPVIPAPSPRGSAALSDVSGGRLSTNSGKSVNLKSGRASGGAVAFPNLSTSSVLADHLTVPSSVRASLALAVPGSSNTSSALPTAVVKVSPQDDDDDDDVFLDAGGMDGGYDEDDVDGEDGGGGSYQAPRSASVSSMRDFVNGAYDLAAFDRDALLTPQEMLSQLAVDSEAGGGAGAWVPLSQQDGISAGVGGGITSARLGLHRLQKEHTFSFGSQPNGASSSQRNPLERSKSGKTTDLKTLAAASSTSDAYSFVQEFFAAAEKAGASIPIASLARTTTPRRENLEKPIAAMKELFKLRVAEQIARDNGLLLPRSATIESDPAVKRAWWVPPNVGEVESFFQPFATSEAHWNVLQKRSADAAAYHTMRQQRAAESAREGTAHHHLAGEGEAAAGEMPLRIFHDDEYGVGGGADDDDGGNDWNDGPDDDDDVNNPILVPNYAALDEDMDAEDDALLARGATMLPDGQQGLAEGLAAAGADASLLQLMERPELITQALTTQHATAATQVDVVRLRRIMWRQTQNVLQRPPELVRFPPSAAEVEEGRKVKAQMARRAKRGREEDHDEDDDADPLKMGVERPVHRFASVVAGVLPHVKHISATGSLSPAFLFFSLLFLANEHGLYLENREGDVDDVFLVNSVDH